MAGQITLRGRFSPGSEVRLVRVDGEHTLRAEGGETVDTKTVDKDGVVSFSKGVEVNARYFIVGQLRGEHLEVRARGRDKDDPSEVLENAPMPPERVKLSDGSYVDEAPEQHEKPDYAEGAPHLAQRHVPKNTPQRSDTPRGSAHPLDPEERAPYPSQEDEEFTKGKVPQMSDTPHGMATPLDLGVAQAQRDVKKGTLQRSDTPLGVATPIPQGGPVETQQMKESSEAKVKRGEPGKAAAAPIGGKPPTGASRKESDKHEEEVRESLAAARERSAERFEDDPLVDEELTGEELDRRAAELNIEGRSTMTADEKRKAIADAQSNPNKEK